MLWSLIYIVALIPVLTYFVWPMQLNQPNDKQLPSLFLLQLLSLSLRQLHQMVVEYSCFQL